jgi:hypothetical protein
MKKIKIICLVLPLLIFLTGCQKDKESTDGTKESPQVTSTTEKNELKSESRKSSVTELKELSTNDDDLKIDVSKRMIVKTGSISIESDVYEDAEKKVNDVVKNLGGFIANATSTVNTAGKKSGTITVKVPVDKYDNLVLDISAIGKVNSKQINANDVTEEYLDLASREKTQKELEERLIKLLSEKTAKLSDIIEIEEKLASVRQKIETIQGKMKLTQNQAQHSTLTISLYEPSMIQTSSGGGFFYELGQALKKGVYGFTNILTGLIVFLITILPVALFIWLVVYIVLRIVRKRKKAKV